MVCTCCDVRDRDGRDPDAECPNCGHLWKDHGDEPDPAANWPPVADVTGRAGAEVYTTVRHYRVSVWPEAQQCSHARDMSLTVAYRGSGRWAVLLGIVSIGKDGSPDTEHIPSERRDEWLAMHRHTLDDALRLARSIAPAIQIGNSGPASEAYARHREQWPDGNCGC